MENDKRKNRRNQTQKQYNMLKLEDIKDHKTYYYINWMCNKYKQEQIPICYGIPGVKHVRFSSHVGKDRYYDLMSIKTGIEYKRWGDLEFVGEIQNSSRSSINENILVTVSNPSPSSFDIGTVRKDGIRKEVRFGEYSFKKKHNNFYFFNTQKEAYLFLKERIDLIIERTKNSIEWIESQLLVPGFVNDIKDLKKIDRLSIPEKLSSGQKIYIAQYELNWDTCIDSKRNLVIPIYTEPKLITLNEDTYNPTYYYSYIHSDDLLYGRCFSKDLIISFKFEDIIEQYIHKKNSTLIQFRNDLIACLEKFTNSRERMIRKLEKLV